jgi:hypothetical protein
MLFTSVPTMIMAVAMKRLMNSITSFSFSYSNGEPQTPTRTPTSAAFADAAFQTPKFESSFYDPRVTWDTADPYASSPELLKTPQRFVFGATPSNAMQQQQQPLDSSFGQHLSPNVAVKGPGITDTAKRRQVSRPAAYEDEGPGTVNSVRSAATIQTPPPTRTSRRKALDAGNEGGQGYMGTAKKLSAVTETQLETPSRIIASSPHLFANFQNSPDFFQFSNIDSSEPPFLPQQKLFVDQHVNNLSSHGSTDPFADAAPSLFTTVAAATALQAYALDVPPLPTIQGSMDLPEFSISTEANFGIGPTAPADAALFPTPFSASPRVSITKADDDPSLFLSSPARRFGPPQPLSEPKSAPRPTRQPYHHQTEEAKRELLLQRHSRPNNQPLSGPFPDDNEDEDFTPRAASIIRPGLARSKTTTALTSQLSHSRQQSQQSFASSLSSTSGIKKTPSKGRISPVKSMRQSLPRVNSSCLPSRSQSLILKIDKDGRAKTEFQAEGGFTGLTDPISEMDIDDSVTESEADSAEFSDCPAAGYSMHNHSFGFPATSLTRPDISRTGSLSRPNSKSSFASTVASSASGRRSPWAESRARRPQSAVIPSEWVNTPRRFSTPGNANFTRQSSSTDSTLPDPEEDSGDAQHALRQLLAGRGRNTIGRHSTSNTMRMRMPVSQSMHHLQSSPPGLSGAIGMMPSEATSPTTLTDPDLATPSTGRHSNPSNGTRCVCKSMDNGGHLMIQW